MLASRGSGMWGPLGQGLDGLGERELVPQLDELEDAAPGAAGEALEDLLGRRDKHRGLVVLVEGADADELAPRLLEGNVLADQVDDVRRLRHLLNKLFREPQRQLR